MLIIDDSNFHQYQPSLTPENRHAFGLVPRNTHPTFAKQRCYGAADIPLIPWAEIPDRIADLERRKASLWHIWNDSEVGVLNQSSLSYCHAFSAVMGVKIDRVVRGLPYIELSASSVGAPVTGYRNAGAWILEDLEQMRKVGVATTEYVPMLTTRRGDFKAGWEQSAARHKVLEWSELESRNLHQQICALLSLKVTCNGLNYWGHAVTDLAVKDLDPSKRPDDESRYGILFLNSWGDDWGDRGCAVRAGRQKYVDEAYLVESVTLSI